MVFFSLLIFSCGETSSVDDASREGILIMGNSGEPKGLDPHIVSGVLESNVIRSLFEGLVEAHPSKDGIAMPGVAEKWYPVNPKRPDEWVFELRKDAQWSDGEELTADDFFSPFVGYSPLPSLPITLLCFITSRMQNSTISLNVPTCFFAKTPILLKIGGIP